MTKLTRKTVEVGKLLSMANHFLSASNTNQDEREAVSQFMEAILFETGNYQGFRYLPNDHGELDFETDGTRRFYFPSKKIQSDFEAELRNINVLRV